MKTYPLMLLTAGLLLGADGAEDNVQRDLKNIQGTWTIVSVEDSGRKTPDEDIKNLKWFIAKDKITYTFGDKITERSYTLDPTKKPKWIDLTEGDRITLGIYELEGDSLKVSFPEGRKERSTAFESKPNSVNDILIILRREKP